MNKKKLNIIKRIENGESLDNFPEYEYDIDLVIVSLKKNIGTISSVIEKFKDNKEFVLKAMYICPIIVSSMSDRLKDDQEVMEKAIQIFNISMFDYASDRLKANESFVSKALEKAENYGVMKIMSSMGESLKINRDFLYRAMKINSIVMCYMCEEVKNDEDFIIKVIDNFPKIYPHIGQKLQTKESIYLKVLEKDGLLLAYFRKGFRKDKRIVLKAIENNPRAIMSSAYFDDKSAVLFALERDGSLLRSLSEKMKDDEDVVKIAIKNSPESFISISERLKSNKEVLECLRDSNPCYLFFANNNTLIDEEESLKKLRSYCESNANKKEMKNIENMKGWLNWYAEKMTILNTIEEKDWMDNNMYAPTTKKRMKKF